MPLSQQLSGYGTFEATVDHAVARFAQTKVAQKITAGAFNLGGYHSLLRTLFYQTWHAPYSFALAGAKCDWDYPDAKEYLLLHAEEEKTHWRWIIDDLNATGSTAADPRKMAPHWSALSYVSLNFHVADSFPLGRLAIAAVLETIGPTYAPSLGVEMLQCLRITPAQASFFVSHGETDKHHSAELMELIANLPLDDRGWQSMCIAAETAGRLYCSMYDHEEYS